MPSSRICTVPYAISVVKQLQPRSILDVGVGFGKWGYLFREFTDIIASESKPSRYPKAGWETRIDGIEGFPVYLHDGHRYIYDTIYEGNASDLLGSLGSYDLVFFGDIIEHFPKAEGKRLLRQAISQARQGVMLTTPRFETNQADLCANELERHRSLWNRNDFQEVGNCKSALPDPATQIVFFPKPGYEHTWLAPEARGIGRWRRRIITKWQKIVGMRTA